MEKLYSQTDVLRACHCDLHGEWKPSAIMEAMQETATTHCEHLGLSRPVTDALGIAWVLSRARVELKRTPRLGEAITVQTWPQEMKHMFYPRLNAFWDSNGEQIGAASSLWVLMDVRQRRIVNSDEVLGRLPDNSDMPAGVPLGTIRPLTGEAQVTELIPPYSDFDLNGHVNNTKYLDWACNALGHEALEQCRVASFAVCYDAEILPGETIRTELLRRDDHFSFCGFNGGRRRFCVVGELEKR